MKQSYNYGYPVPKMFEKSKEKSFLSGVGKEINENNINVSLISKCSINNYQSSIQNKYPCGYKNV